MSTKRPLSPPPKHLLPGHRCGPGVTSPVLPRGTGCTAVAPPPARTRREPTQRAGAGLQHRDKRVLSREWPALRSGVPGRSRRTHEGQGPPGSREAVAPMEKGEQNLCASAGRIHTAPQHAACDERLEPPKRRFPQSQAGHEMVVIYSFNFPPSPLPAPYTHLQGDSGSPTTVSIFKFKTEFIHALKLAAVVANLLKEV